MKTILIIEDEPTLQKTLGEILARDGYKILNALDGEIGLNLAQKEKPDLILLDLIIPKINGLEVLRKLKESGETKEIPVIILTNLGGMEYVDKALELGATTYLVKSSYTLKDVVGKIKKTLQE